MIIKRVKLTNFRSHEGYVLECRKKTSLIVGQNGSGKTSVLEAIYEALRGKSFRAADEEIVKRGEGFYRVELLYDDGEKVAVTYEGEDLSAGDTAQGVKARGKKTFVVGDRKWARLPKKNRYPVVLFLPDDLHLVGSSPGRRRDYFDRVLTELDDGYGTILSRYNKALRQRNELLKNSGVTAEALFSWNVMLARYGCEVRRRRAEFVEAVNGRVTEVYRSIAANEDEVQISYQFDTTFLGDHSGPLGQVSVTKESSIQTGTKIKASSSFAAIDESKFLAKLEGDWQRDSLLGHTSYGAHRDNFEFEFNGRAAEGSASRGEVRSIMLALKFIEADLVFERTGRRPVVLLDDVFSELDEVRQKCLVRNFKDNQVIITSVDEV